ncbi:MAG: AAA family ATPase [Candidatus Wallbacteria bacterium]|nr:AAA family ATPase [Candidatus Wallbacteria bacterium]
MKIKRAFIGNFRPLSDKEFLFSRGFNFIFGENEAGKTSLFNFFRFFFFYKGKKGITKNSPLSALKDDLDGCSGEMNLEEAGEIQRIVRSGKKTEPKSLSGIFDWDERKYFNIFSLTLSSIETLKNDPVHPFYSLLSGSRGVNLGQVEKELSCRLEALHTDRSQKKPMDVSRSVVNNLEQKLELQRLKSAQLKPLTQELNTLCAEKTKLEELLQKISTEQKLSSLRKKLVEDHAKIQAELKEWDLNPELLASLSYRLSGLAEKKPILTGAFGLKEKLTRLYGEREKLIQESQLLQEESDLMSQSLLRKEFKLSHQNLFKFLYLIIPPLLIALFVLSGASYWLLALLLSAFCFAAWRQSVSGAREAEKNLDSARQLVTIQEKFEKIQARLESTELEYREIICLNKLPEEHSSALEILRREEHKEIIHDQEILEIQILIDRIRDRIPEFSMPSFIPAESELYLKIIAELQNITGKQHELRHNLQLIELQLSTLPEVKNTDTLEQETRDKIQALTAKITDLNLRIRDNSGQDPEILSQELETARSRLALQLNEYGSLRIALYFVQTIKKKMEDKMQPATLDIAGRFLEKITAGKYNSIVKTQEDFLIMDKLGKSLNLSILSTGTFAQLYFALSAAYLTSPPGLENDKSMDLPLFIDEAWAVFDEKRAEAALEILLEISRKNQVFFFSCHRYLLDIYKKLAPDGNIVELNQ